jgi:hypothetical protein
MGGPVPTAANASNGEKGKPADWHGCEDNGQALGPPPSLPLKGEEKTRPVDRGFQGRRLGLKGGEGEPVGRGWDGRQRMVKAGIGCSDGGNWRCLSHT